MSLLPLATYTWDDSEIDAIKRLLIDKQLTMGDNVKEFEKKFAEFVGSKYALMVNSGSSANLLAIASLFFCENPLKAGDEVIVPAVSWATTYSPLQQYNLKLKFVDISLETLNIDLDQLEDAISENTRAIFSVNIVGNPVDYPRMKEIIGDRDIRIIEDNCESLGATIDGKQAGTFGVMGTFSSYFSHHISTIEGGVVVTDDKELYHILLSLRAHGWTRHLPADTEICKKSTDEFYNLFDFILPGYNVRPTELAGVLGIEQLIKLPDMIEKRRQNGEIFKDLFKDVPIVTIQQETGKSSWFGFALIFHIKEMKNRFIKLLRDNGIECRPIVAGNFCKNPVIKYFDYTIHGDLKNSNAIHDCGIYVGNHHVPITKQLLLIKNLITQLDTAT